MITWELRYHGPRVLDDVMIETFTEDEVEARELADRFLKTQPSPSVRFVRLRKIVVASSADHDDLRTQYGEVAHPPAMRALSGAVKALVDAKAKREAAQREAAATSS
jgi:hypothetical protein